MDHYISKSETYQKAAACLNDATYYPAVPHSSYYSCVLYLQHIWFYIFRKSKKEYDMERERQIKEKKRHIGTHEVLINYMGNFIKKNDGIQRWMNFVLNIIQLKEIRVKADYNDEAIVKAQSENSIVLANKVLTTLKSINYGCD